MYRGNEIIIIIQVYVYCQVKYGNVQQIYFVERMTTYPTLKPMQQCDLELSVKNDCQNFTLTMF